jgi:hypothetical protein
MSNDAALFTLDELGPTTKQFQAIAPSADPVEVE